MNEDRNLGKEKNCPRPGYQFIGIHFQMPGPNTHCILLTMLNHHDKYISLYISQHFDTKATTVDFLFTDPFSHCKTSDERAEELEREKGLPACIYNL